MLVRKSFLAFTIAASLPGAGRADVPAALPAVLPGVDPSVEFPDPASATRRAGVFVPPRNVALVTAGLTKQQVYALLDVPHFHEGLFGVRRWNYILNFHTGSDKEFRSCQYQIRFGAKARVEATHFRDQICADLFAALIKPSASMTVIPPETEARLTRSYDFSFSFDRSDISDEGKRIIGEAAAEIHRGGYKQVIITGFTDTSGSVRYNDALAARRADAAAKILRDQVSIPVYSRSARDLFVETGASVREERNRRVTIGLYAEATERASVTDVR